MKKQTYYSLSKAYRAYTDDIKTRLESDERIAYMGVAVPLQRLERCNGIEKNFVYENYNLIEPDQYYLLKGINKSDLYISLVAKYFPDGYRPDGKEDYDKLRTFLTQEYGSNFHFPSQRRLVEYGLSDVGFCRISKQLLKRRSQCAIIPRRILEAMEAFIRERKSCTYNELYNAFADDLNALGIDNCHYLQGEICSFLPWDMSRSRKNIEVIERKKRK